MRPILPIIDALLAVVPESETPRARLQGLRESVAYRRGYQTAQRHERKLRYASDVTITKQELATMNHAYDHGDA